MSGHALDKTLIALVDAAPDGIVLVDTEGRIVLANRAAEELFGHARGEARPVYSTQQ